MAQPVLYDGVDTHTLPYPQAYKLNQVPRSAEFQSYVGTITRDYPTGRVKFPGTVFIEWQELSTADMTIVNTAYRALAGDLDVVWTYTDPDGVPWDATLNPEQPNLQTQRYAGPEGTVLYTARLSLAVE